MRILWLVLIGLFTFAWSPRTAEAAPQITAATGTFIHGSAITITGSAFGAGGKTPLTWDDFEDGTVGQNLAASPKVGTWTPQSQPTSQYSTTLHHSGNKAAYSSKSIENSSMYTSVIVPNISGALQDTFYYASWWGYWHANCSTPGQIKLIQMWGTYQVGDYNPGFFHGGGSSTYIALEYSGISQQMWIDNAPPDVWAQYQLVLKQSDVNVANGIIQIYLDGNLIYNKVNVVTREKAGESWQALKPHEGMTNQSGCTGNGVYALDDIYMNNSWARVVLGDAPTYATSTKFEIQPVNWQTPTWSSSSINVKFNQGNYANGQTAYIYVVDTAGAVNANGFPVTIGSGSGGDTTPPTVPLNLRIQ